MSNVICDHAKAFCRGIGCPHSFPHVAHDGLQTEWDGEDECTEPGFCDGGEGFGRNVWCRCVSVDGKQGVGDHPMRGEGEGR